MRRLPWNPTKGQLHAKALRFASGAKVDSIRQYRFLDWKSAENKRPLWEEHRGAGFSTIEELCQKDKAAPSIELLTQHLSDLMKKRLKPIKDKGLPQALSLMPAERKREVLLTLIKALEATLRLQEEMITQTPKLFPQTQQIFAQPSTEHYGIAHFLANDVFGRRNYILGAYFYITDIRLITNFNPLFGALAYLRNKDVPEEVSSAGQFVSRAVLYYSSLLKESLSEKEFFHIVWVVTNLYALIPKERRQFESVISGLRSQLLEIAAKGPERLFPDSVFQIQLFRNYLVLLKMADSFDAPLPNDLKQGLLELAFNKIDIDLLYFKEIIATMKVMLEFPPENVDTRKLACELARSKNISLANLSIQELLIFVNFLKAFDINNYFFNFKNGTFFENAYRIPVGTLPSQVHMPKLHQIFNILDYALSITNEKAVGNVNIKFLLRNTIHNSVKNIKLEHLYTRDFLNKAFECYLLSEKHVHRQNFNFLVMPWIQESLQANSKLVLKMAATSPVLIELLNKLSEANTESYSSVSMDFYSKAKTTGIVDSVKDTFKVTNDFFIQYSIGLTQPGMEKSVLSCVFNMLRHVQLPQAQADQYQFIAVLVENFSSLNDPAEVSLVVRGQQCLSRLQSFMDGETKAVYLNSCADHLSRLSEQELEPGSLIDILEAFSDFDASQSLEIFKHKLNTAVKEILTPQAEPENTQLNPTLAITSVTRYNMFPSPRAEDFHRILPLLALYGNFFGEATLELLKHNWLMSIKKLKGPQVLKCLLLIPSNFPQLHELLPGLLANILTSFPCNYDYSSRETSHFDVYIGPETIDSLVADKAFPQLIRTLIDRKLWLTEETQHCAVALLLHTYIRKTETIDVDLLADAFGLLQPFPKCDVLLLKPLVADSWFPVVGLDYKQLLHVPFVLYSPQLRSCFFENLSRAIAESNFDDIAKFLTYCIRNKVYHHGLVMKVLESAEALVSQTPDLFQELDRLEIPDKYFEEYYITLIINIEKLSLDRSQYANILFNYHGQRAYIAMSEGQLSAESTAIMEDVLSQIASSLITEKDEFSFRSFNAETETKRFQIISDNSPMTNQLFIKKPPMFMNICFPHRDALEPANQNVVPYDNSVIEEIELFRPYLQRFVLFKIYSSRIRSLYDLSQEDMDIEANKMAVLFRNFANITFLRKHLTYWKTGPVQYRTAPSGAMCAYWDKKHYMAFPKELMCVDVTDPANAEKFIPALLKFFVSEFSVGQESVKEKIEVVTFEEFRLIVSQNLAGKQWSDKEPLAEETEKEEVLENEESGPIAEEDKVREL